MRVLRGRRRRAGSRSARTPTASARPSRSRSSTPVAPGDALLVHAGTALARARRRRVRFVDEFRDAELGRVLAGEILATVEPGRHYKVMEVCGGHTHSIYKYGVDDLLPENVELVHGPGCPVCVIPMGRVDDAIAMAHEPGVIFTCFGDMMRVPGSHGTLLEAKAEGADIRMVYSPLDALRIAQGQPRPRGRLLRDRLRDDRAVDRADAQARPGRGRRELLLLLQPRDDRAAAARAARLARPAPRRLHRPRPRLDRRRRAAARVHPAPTTASRSSSRASSRVDILQSVLMILRQLARGPLRGREPVQARRPLRGQPARAAR